VRERRARLADTILLINPAYEASRYEAIHQLASQLQPSTYHPPLLVTITSDKDLATKRAFPLGRWINGVFEKKTSDDQKIAIRNTPGHIERYLTHDLAVGTAGQAACTDWREIYEFDEANGRLRLKKEYENAATLKPQLQKNAKAEVALLDEFFKRHGGVETPSIKEPLARSFCGAIQLTQRTKKSQDKLENAHPNTPVWNIHTSEPIINSHNDFMTPLFIDFIRQLYLDGEFVY
jgi:hypothetical protein